jgi:hypothetical protein
LQEHIKIELRSEVSEGIVDQNYGGVVAVFGKERRGALWTAASLTRISGDNVAASGVASVPWGGEAGERAGGCDGNATRDGQGT